ncbi:MAG: hypothetical protein ACI9BD_000877 [Candidatus Marinamargulisbacteria bacterium]|jgi:hypothetical protein
MNDSPNIQETRRLVLNGLMRRYKERVPDVNKIITAMCDATLIGSPSDIINDHIAFRTMGVDHLGIQSLEKIFLHLGYTRQDPYRFAKKKLDAYWYAPPDDQLPRIFISELRVSDLSQQAQSIINAYTNEVPSDPVLDLDLDDGAAIDLFLHRSLWRRPTWADYQTLQKESEYAAWVIYNRYYLNHFTITIHALPDGYNTIAQFNQFLETHQIELNDANGKIKTSKDHLLIQSSTVAEMVDAEFEGDHGMAETHRIAGSYVEFAERKPLKTFQQGDPQSLSRDQRRDGFDAGNADGIFESTYTSQTESEETP